MSANIVNAVETLHQFMEQTGCTTLRMWTGRDNGKHDGNRYMICIVKAMDYEEQEDDDGDTEEFV